ncbi:hypothetical protein COEREDRAFT_80001 [Coemansia reversa NRRL 1564]|uniref:OCRE domain-containing protein n=1 Tax=Coemansia reversa (strain ATCC 12441 / NRRL 1564) TaxID=763665 RepID=A0A2G5BH56_COERN|nr:hypothetical protein COEREDRAFT_80001 [Coemansia reversa NRRL 1564]|eukprot:PIA18057.1 hypothetical protein COEREDRAFT_80001 [Coemansia reversa NRRL 1564]
MSLSLVPEYDSSSSSSSSPSPSQSDSESEDKTSAPSQQPSVSGTDGTVHRTTDSYKGFGTALSSILPKPKNTTQPSEGTSAENKKKVRIMVDLPPPSRIETATEAGNNSLPTAARLEKTTEGDSSSKTTGSLFSELSSILPAPKNRTKPSDTHEHKPGDAVTFHNHVAAERPLIPHSISSKRRLKAKSAAQLIASNPETDNSGDKGDDMQIKATTTAESSAPFFTIDDATRPDNDELEMRTDGGDIDEPTALPGHSELIYDPASGYYYDSSNGLYYHYDQTKGRYIDARELYPAADQPEHKQAFGLAKDENPSTASAIDEAELEGMIGRRELRRGEARIALSGGGVKTISQSMQLSDSGYSDSKAAAEYSAKRAMEQQRQKTRHAIDSDAVSKQKKSKHNIMYLALQAQEQEAALKDVHANRKRAKKEARSKYGY